MLHKTILGWVNIANYKYCVCVTIVWCYMKSLRIDLDDKEWEDASKLKQKQDMTWKEMLLRGVNIK